MHTSLSIKRICLIKGSSKNTSINIEDASKDNKRGETGNRLLLGYSKWEEADCDRLIKALKPQRTVP